MELKIRQAEGCDDAGNYLWDTVWDPTKGLGDWGLSEGTMIRPSAKNRSRNSSAAGFTPGFLSTAAGVPPLYWGLAGRPTGVEYDLQSVGVEVVGGVAVPYLQVRVFGTPAATQSSRWRGESNGIYLAGGFNGGAEVVPGEVVSSSYYLACVAGTPPPLFRSYATEFVSFGNAVIRNEIIRVDTFPVGALQRIDFARTVQPFSGFANTVIEFDFTAGVAVDFTLRFGGWQIESGATPTDLILTAGAPVTRSAVYGPIVDPDNRGGLRATAALHTAVMLCLFTDRRISENHPLRYLAGADRRGWWGDAVDVRADLAETEMGSLWWVLERAPLTTEIARFAAHEGQAALAPLIAQGAAVRSEVVVEINEARGRLEAVVRLFAVDGSKVFDRRFESLWETTK